MRLNSDVKAQMPKVIAVDHVQLAMPKGEEQSARAFYAGVLGLEEIRKPANLAARGGVWFRCGGLQVHLGVEESFRPAKKAHPAFVVDDLAGFAKSLSGRGLSVQRDAEQVVGVVRLFTADPFGNRIELVQRHESTTP